MSRTEVKEVLDLDEFETAMAGRVWRSNHAEKLLDGAPGAYRDIVAVMQAQSDLHEPVDELVAIVNHKGI